MSKANKVVKITFILFGSNSLFQLHTVRMSLGLEIFLERNMAMAWGKGFLALFGLLLFLHRLLFVTLGLL